MNKFIFCFPFKKLLLGALLLSVVLPLASYPLLSSMPQLRMGSLKILDRNGVLLREIASSPYGTACPVRRAELPRHLVAVFLVAEDKRFYRHHGVDPLAIARAAYKNLARRRVVSGGSTITQQLVRNMYHYPRRMRYKAVEALRAVSLELRYPKERILEEYLNRIPFGNGAYGVEAAARLYFDKPAKDLTVAESAFLCALPSSNRLYDPYRNPRAVFRRQKRILSALYNSGGIDKAGYLIALHERLSLYPRRRSFLAPHFCGMVLERLPQGMTGEVRTTLDYALQMKLEYIIDNHLARIRGGNVNNAAALVIDNATGDILALAGSADFFDEAHAGQVNGVTALRQPGSALKPFVYGMAFEKGLRAGDTLADIRSSLPITGGGFFIPRNYDRGYHGMVRARTALACSYNIATVNLAARYPGDMLLAKLRQAGFDSLKKDADFYGPGLCLGNGEVTLLELTRAYAGLARGGVLEEVRLFPGEPRTVRQRFLTPGAAALVTDILSDNNAREPAFGEFSPLNLPFRCAAKTGTSKNFRDNWTEGYTPRYTVGVWVGNFSGAPMYSVSGISGAAPIFRDIMLALELRNPALDFPERAQLVRRKVCARSGMLPTERCAAMVDELFIPGTEQRESCTLHRAVGIDRRNGLLASASCPPQYVEQKVYEFYPAEYGEWARGAGVELPPSERSRLEPTPGKGNVGCGIEYPKDGDVFTIDPVLRREYQTITLAPRVDEGVTGVLWRVDGSTIAATGYPFTVPWTLSPGRHTITCAVLRDGLPAAVSGKVRINVLQ